MSLLRKSILIVLLALLCAAAVFSWAWILRSLHTVHNWTTQNAFRQPRAQSEFPGDFLLGDLTGPLKIMWFDPNLRTSEDKEQLRALQLKREAFRPFSERVVSARCASILQPTLDGLDKVGKAIRDSRETREAFLLLNPVLDALTNSLDMTETFYYYVELTPEEIEQEKKMVEEEEKEEEKTPSLSTVERTRQRALRLHELESKRLLTSWTEEKEPQLLFKYRLRNVEKRLAAFQYVLEFVPDPVRQELEERGFVQQTKNLRTNVRSLLTCEGVTHVTMATLKDELGGRETDDFMDHNAARKAMDDFSRSFHTRLLFQRMGARMPDEHAVSIFQKTVNTTQVESRWSVGYREGIEQLKNTLAGLSAPDIKFQWARQDSRQKNRSGRRKPAFFT